MRKPECGIHAPTVPDNLFGKCARQTSKGRDNGSIEGARMVRECRTLVVVTVRVGRYMIFGEHILES